MRRCPEGYTIETVSDAPKYEGLRALWCEVFGDSPEYVDAFYGNFDGDIRGYAAVDAKGEVCSALTLFLCGTFEGRPVYVSYAVCTAPAHRSRGLAAALVTHAKDEVLKKGGISIVSPAEPQLEAYYESLGYEPHFFASCISLLTEDDEDFEIYDIFEDAGYEEEDDEPFEPLIPALEIKSADMPTYRRYREAYLSDRPHIELSEAMLNLVESECEPEGGFRVINDGDAICVINASARGSLVMSEFILSPALEELSLEIDEEIAVAAARQLDAAEVTYIAPGMQRCQAMAAGIQASDDEEASAEKGYIYGEAYYGFPIE